MIGMIGLFIALSPLAPLLLILLPAFSAMQLAVEAPVAPAPQVAPPGGDIK